jgi:hypothetical protein
MYNLNYKLNYIQSYLRRTDLNGLACFKDYLKECLTTKDQIDLVNDFEKYLEDAMAKDYFDGLEDEDDQRQTDTKA